jgi:hypothetical protein
VSRNHKYGDDANLQVYIWQLSGFESVKTKLKLNSTEKSPSKCEYYIDRLISLLKVMVKRFLERDFQELFMEISIRSATMSGIVISHFLEVPYSDLSHTDVVRRRKLLINLS